MAYKKRHRIVGLAERLNTLYSGSGMTQEQIAQQIGTDRKTVCRWIRGEYAPDTAAIIRLCKLFDVSADYLLFGKEDN